MNWPFKKGDQETSGNSFLLLLVAVGVILIVITCMLGDYVSVGLGCAVIAFLLVVIIRSLVKKHRMNNDHK